MKYIYLNIPDIGKDRHTCNTNTLSSLTKLPEHVIEIDWCHKVVPSHGAHNREDDGYLWP